MIKFNGNREDLDKCGIYCIINLKDGKKYIGSTYSFYKRLYGHSYKLKNKKHNNPIMQNVFEKYGLDVFQFSIIEICNIENIISVEQRYLDEIFKDEDHYDKYYNVARNASAPMAGRKHTPESLKKMRGENHNAFGKRGEKCPNFGRKASPETIAKKKLFISPNKGKRLTDEQKRHLSEINTGEKIQILEKNVLSKPKRKSVIRGGEVIILVISQKLRLRILKLER